MSIGKTNNLALLGDERGSLVVIESARSIPFEIRRVYYLFGTKEGVARGYHAHKSLNQIAICVAGRCRMVLDDGTTREDLWLDSPAISVDIPPLLWHEMHDFSDDCVLMVLASDYYDESDYIRDYSDFLQVIER